MQQMVPKLFGLKHGVSDTRSDQASMCTHPHPSQRMKGDDTEHLARERVGLKDRRSQLAINANSPNQ